MNRFIPGQMVEVLYYRRRYVGRYSHANKGSVGGCYVSFPTGSLLVPTRRVRQLDKGRKS